MASIKWFLGLVVAVLVGLMTITASILFRPYSTKSDFEAYSKRYDPIFRNVLVDKAYGLLSDVHLSELRSEPQLIRNLNEIETSLSQVGAFDNRNFGLKSIFNLINSFVVDNSRVFEESFLATDPLKDKLLNMTPQEAGFYYTFQGLIYLQRYRRGAGPNNFQNLLAARKKFEDAKLMNVGISNTWFGLGICLLEFSTVDMQFELIPQARKCFQVAYELHRSPINLAAHINNLAYTDMMITYYDSFNLSEERDGNIVVSRKTPRELEKIKTTLLNCLENFNTALTYDPNPIAIHLSIAECYCNLALCNQAILFGPGRVIEFNKDDTNLIEAMRIIRESQSLGFKEWIYLFSRGWISNTLFRVNEFRTELLSFANY